MPGMYQVGDYDVAGFCVGVVERDEIIDGSKIKAGQVIIALPSSGFHSNGFSLVRKVFPDFDEEFEGKPLFETLLVPTKLYQNDIFKIKDAGIEMSGIAHITGGGLIENVPRIINDGLTAVIEKAKINVPTVMQELAKRGGIAENEMFGTFNMGVGMSVTVADEDKEKAVEILKANGEDAYIIGSVIKSDEGVIIE